MRRNGDMLHTKALDTVALAHGYKSWSLLMADQNRLQRNNQRVEDRVPDSLDAHLSAYERPEYVRAIFRC
jgi:hypothetical protein